MPGGWQVTTLASRLARFQFRVGRRDRKRPRRLKPSVTVSVGSERSVGVVGRRQHDRHDVDRASARRRRLGSVVMAIVASAAAGPAASPITSATTMAPRNVLAAVTARDCRSIAATRRRSLGEGRSWRRWGSNPLPLACHASALPTELRPRVGLRAYQAGEFARPVERPASYTCTDGDERRHPQRRHPRRRHPEVPVQRDAGQRDRAALAGPLGSEPHLLEPEPDRPPRRRPTRTRRPTGAVRARHVPVPERQGAPRRPPARLHRHRRVRALPTDERLQRPARDGLRRLRIARRAVRGADRAAPARHDEAATSTRIDDSCVRSGSRTILAAVRRPATRPTTTGPSGSSCRSTTPGTTKRRTGPGRSTSWSTSSAAATARRRTNIAFDDLGDREQRELDRCAPARVRRRSSGELVPGPGHGPRQRRGDRRRPQRPGQLPRVPPLAATVDAAHHRLRRPPHRRPRRARLVRTP